MRRLMADTMDLGKAGGGRAGTQRYVTGIIDPSSKWVHAEVFQGKAPREEQTRQVLVNGLKSLRDGLLAHKTGNSAQVFSSQGTPRLQFKFKTPPTTTLSFILTILIPRQPSS